MRTGISTAHSVVEPSARTRFVAGAVVVAYALLTMIPLVWIILTGFKTPPDAISYPPKVMFSPSIQGYCNLFTTRSRQTPENIAALPPASDICDQGGARRQHGGRARRTTSRCFVNSLIIAFGSTVLSVGIGVMAAYAFSRFDGAAEGRPAVLHPGRRVLMPPIAVAIPIYLMYR